jgi:hypothetical protein
MSSKRSLFPRGRARRFLALAALTSAVAASNAVAQPIFSLESDFQGWNNLTDQTWSINHTGRDRTALGSTDGDFAYKFNVSSGFSWGSWSILNRTAGEPPAPDPRWDTLANGTRFLMDFSIVGTKASAADPDDNSKYFALYPAFNYRGGFIDSYNNPPGARTQVAMNPGAVFGVKTQTFVWDYVSANVDFASPTIGGQSNDYLLTHISTNNNFNAGSSFAGYLDNFRAYRARASDPTFAAASGNWADAGNWANGVATGAGAVAIFRPGAGGSTVTVAAPVTAGSLVFDPSTPATSADPYASQTIAGSAVLTLQSSTGEAPIVGFNGTHTIAAPLSLQSDTVVDLVGYTYIDGVGEWAPSSLTAGSVTLAAGKTLRKTSVGTFTVGKLTGGAGSALRVSGPMAITAGGSNTLRVGSLDVAGSGTLDIADNSVVVDYDGASPFATILADVLAGRSGGGKGIVSSLLTPGRGIGIAEANAVGSPVTFGGETIDATAVLVRRTWLGDATLNGTVNFDDLLLLAANYNALTNVNWSKGDFNYDGAVNFDDLLVLAANYNVSGGGTFAGDWALAQSLVPEPASMAALTGTALALLSRRRRSMDRA